MSEEGEETSMEIQPEESEVEKVAEELEQTNNLNIQPHLPYNVASDETPHFINHKPTDPPSSVTLLSLNNVQTHHLDEEPMEADHSLVPPTHATPDTETLEDPGAELAKDQEDKQTAHQQPDITPAVLPDSKTTEEPKIAEPENEGGAKSSDATLVTETKDVELPDSTAVTRTAKEVEQSHTTPVTATAQEVRFPDAPPVTETAEEQATTDPKLETQLPKEEPDIHDDAAVTENDANVLAETVEKQKSEELIKGEKEKPEDQEFTAYTESSKPATVTTEEDATKDTTCVDEVQVDKLDVSYPAPVAAEGEVTRVLLEKEEGEEEKKKKKRALGDHLAEEKANDSAKANKQDSSDKESEVEQGEQEPLASAVAPAQSTKSGDAEIEADEKKEKDKEVLEDDMNAKQGGEGEKVDEKEQAQPTKTANNNVLSKLKHQIGKVKKAFVRRSPSSKGIPVDNRGDIRVQ